MSLFDAELVNKRRKADYFQALVQVRFTLFSWNDGNENSDVSISEISSEPKKAILTQAQKYRNLLKITNPLASAGNNNGIKIYTERVPVVRKESGKLTVRRQSRNNYE